MQILAMDLGRRQATICEYTAESGEHRFTKVQMDPSALHDLIVEREPDRVVIEVGPPAGWICDLVRALDVPVQVANANHEGWRWRQVKRKTDRTDALKLAQLSAMNQLPTVHMPSRKVRQWRALIRHRHKMIDRRIALKNQVHAILLREAIDWPTGKRGWTETGFERLEEMGKPIEEVGVEELWRGQLWVALQELRNVQQLIDRMDTKLDALAAEDRGVRLLRTIPGVGARLSEAIVTLIDDPRRFRRGNEVASYAGLTPRQLESGRLQISGRISKQGNSLMRALLVEAAWLALRHNPWAREVYHRVRAGVAKRSKLAIVAVAKRLLIRCWAMLRDGADWRGPSSQRPSPA